MKRSERIRQERQKAQNPPEIIEESAPTPTPTPTPAPTPPPQTILHPRVGILRHLLGIFFAAAIAATVFTSFTPLGLTFGLGSGLDDIFTPPENGQNAFFPTPTNRPLPRIGIVAGHYGIEGDHGAECPDGLREVDINLDIAARVQQILRAEGYDVDLLSENDERLQMYYALALVSIHADSCAFDTPEATGFKVATSVASNQSNKSERLVNCLYSRYSEVTGMPYHEGVTTDMTAYHAFEEINSDTAAAIIETGFMLRDRQILTQQPELVAQGIANGILCYIYNESASPPGETIP